PASPTPTVSPSPGPTATGSGAPTPTRTATATPTVTATATPSGPIVSSNVTLLLNLGGGLTITSILPVGSSPQDVAVAALNSDMVPDIVTANCDGNSFTVLLS